jgi:hypothetical protein
MMYFACAPRILYDFYVLSFDLLSTAVGLHDY